MLRASRVAAGLPLVDRARLANNAALASYKTGALDDALARWERARLLFERLGDLHSQIAVQLNLCVGYREVGRWTRAKRAGEWALSQAEQSDEHLYAVMAAGNLGDLHFALETWDPATSLYERALSGAIACGDDAEKVECMRRLAAIALATGGDALGLASEAIAAAKQAEQQVEMWRATAVEAVARAHQQDESAAERVECAVNGLRELGATRELANVLRRILLSAYIVYS